MFLFFLSSCLPIHFYLYFSPFLIFPLIGYYIYDQILSANYREWDNQHIIKQCLLFITMAHFQSKHFINTEHFHILIKTGMIHIVVIYWWKITLTFEVIFQFDVIYTLYFYWHISYLSREMFTSPENTVVYLSFLLLLIWLFAFPRRFLCYFDLHHVDLFNHWDNRVGHSCMLHYLY